MPLRGEHSTRVGYECFGISEGYGSERVIQRSEAGVRGRKGTQKEGRRGRGATERPGERRKRPERDKGGAESKQTRKNYHYQYLFVYFR